LRGKLISVFEKAKGVLEHDTRAARSDVRGECKGEKWRTQFRVDPLTRAPFLRRFVTTARSVMKGV